MSRWVIRAVGLAAIFLIAGCSGQEFTDVEGKVTFGGKPLPAALVMFTSEDDIWAASSYLKGDGTFAVSRVPVGAVRVVVRTDEFKNMPDEKGVEALRKKHVPGMPSFDEKVKGFRYVKIPPRYAERGSSDLRFVVAKGGHSKIDIDLK